MQKSDLLIVAGRPAKAGGAKEEMDSERADDGK